MPESADRLQPSKFLDRIGRFAERHRALFTRLGDRETRHHRDRIGGIEIDRPVYITGLARSGTTILLELLAELPGLATHQYRDFPLLQIPIWWNWFLDRAQRPEPEPVERFHADRIRVTPRSPEAMEEILWMHFFDWVHDPARPNVLDRSTLNNEFARFYRDHIRKLLYMRGGRRYLCKGNYNISRLAYVHELFPGARFVIPVRDPVDHVASLVKQQALLAERERANPLVLSYMQLAGHFEFGLDRRPVNFGDGEAVARVRELWERGEEARGFAACWAITYEYIASVLENDAGVRERALVVHYDNLCASPGDELRQIFTHCGLEVTDEQRRRLAERISPPAYYTPDFTGDELAAIEEETASARARINPFSG